MKAIKTTRTMKTTNTQKAPSGVGEWACHSYNWQQGCEHDCKFCYAKAMAVRFQRSTPESWAQPEPRPIQIQWRKKKGRIMLPTSHDITPFNIDDSVAVLHGILKVGNEVLIVSKPHLSCVERLCAELEPYKGQILFRFTIGSINDEVLGYWEPNAPSFAERLMSARHAYKQGFSTSISCEPMLDLNIGAVIKAVRQYVTDAIWLGRANNLRQSIALNCPGDTYAKRMADVLLAEQSDDYLRGLYQQYKDDPMIKYKDSIKKAAGLERPTEAGLDV